jgi:predicted kinase
MARLVVFRGIPGSGKSTMARQILHRYIAEGKTACLYESDMFFMTETGDYNFDAKFLPAAHRWCQYKVREALNNCDVVIVANTNLTVAEMEVWHRMASLEHADMMVYHMKNRFSSVHNVPKDVIAAMEAREADWPGEIVIPAN